VKIVIILKDDPIQTLNFLYLEGRTDVLLPYSVK